MPAVYLLISVVLPVSRAGKWHPRSYQRLWFDMYSVLSTQRAIQIVMYVCMYPYCVTTVSPFNTSPQSLGPTDKLFFHLILFFGCFLTCILLSPSGVLYMLLHQPITVAAGTGAMVASVHWRLHASDAGNRHAWQSRVPVTGIRGMESPVLVVMWLHQPITGGDGTGAVVTSLPVTGTWDRTYIITTHCSIMFVK